MSHATTGSARIVNVATGVEDTGRTVPVRDRRHQSLAVLIGKWINEGRTIETAGIASVPILTSDVYEWAPGGFFVVHSAFGKIGETSVGGVERWIADRTRCTVTMSDGGLTQIAHHESSADGVSWTASMDVTLRKVT